MSKRIKFIFVVILIAIGLTACGGTETEAPTVENNTQTQEQETSVPQVDESSSDVAVAGSTSYTINTAASTVGWLGSKAVGGSHYGSIDILEGSFVVDNGTLLSGSAVMDMTSMVNENLTGDDAARLMTHIKDGDFFDVQNYPTSRIDILSAAPLGNGAYTVNGNLTIKDISNPIAFLAQVVEGNNNITLNADIVFDRTLYDITYNSGSLFSDLGDKAINDEVEMTVAVLASNTSTSIANNTDTNSSSTASTENQTNDANTNNFDDGRPPGPDFSAAAEILGIAEETLKSAVGEPGQGPPDFAAAAAQLGLFEQELTDALGVPARGSQDGQGGSPPAQGTESNTQIDTSASAVTGGSSSFKLEAWADNWFAAYLEDALIVEDSVSINTERSFNAESVTFEASYPLTLNFILKDFKENDTGLEYIGSNKQQMGDGGFIMQLTELSTGNVVAVSGSDWACTVIHEAPLDKSCERTSNPVAGTALCDFTDLGEPSGWKSANYNDSGWTATTIHSENAVSPKDGYSQIRWDSSAQFIWGPDLETNNTVLCRMTVNAP